MSRKYVNFDVEDNIGKYFKDVRKSTILTPIFFKTFSYHFSLFNHIPTKRGGLVWTKTRLRYKQLIINYL